VDFCLCHKKSGHTDAVVIWWVSTVILSISLLKGKKGAAFDTKQFWDVTRLQTDLKYHFERNFELQSSLYHQFRIAPCISPVWAYYENSKKIRQNMLGKSGETPQPRKMFEFRGTSHCRLQTSTFLKITSNILFHIFSQC